MWVNVSNKADSFAKPDRVYELNAWAFEDRVSRRVDIFRYPHCSDGAQWFSFHDGSCYSEIVYSPQYGISTWDVPMTSDIEMTKEAVLSFKYGFTALNEDVIHKPKVLYRLRHSDFWNYIT